MQSQRVTLLFRYFCHTQIYECKNLSYSLLGNFVCLLYIYIFYKWVVSGFVGRFFLGYGQFFVVLGYNLSLYTMDLNASFNHVILYS